MPHPDTSRQGTVTNEPSPHWKSETHDYTEQDGKLLKHVGWHDATH